MGPKCIIQIQNLSVSLLEKLKFINLNFSISTELHK